MHFSDAHRYPPGTHYGLIVIRVPNAIKGADLLDVSVARLQTLAEDDIKGNIVIIEPDRTRIRRKPA